MHNSLTYDSEVYRKLIHITSSFMPLCIWYYGIEIFMPFIIFFAIIFPILDYLRIYNKFIYKFYSFFFAFVTRPNESNTLTGASWIFISTAITSILFDERIVIISLLVLSISDSAAAIIGIKYGKTKFFNKSLEGTLAFSISTSFILFSLSDAFWLIKVIAILLSTIVELFSSNYINDNLSIPLIIGMVLSIESII